MKHDKTIVISELKTFEREGQQCFSVILTHNNFSIQLIGLVKNMDLLVKQAVNVFNRENN